MLQKFDLRVIFSFLFTLTYFSVKAQYVSIPDSVFAMYIANNVSAVCITGNNTTGWRLDTTCTALLTDSSITVSVGVSNLSGLQYFKNLRTLNCSYSSITSLPPLPGTLKRLICRQTRLTGLPPLPSTLEYLDCSVDSFVHSLPSLPISLTSLYCDLDSISSLPTLPSNLINLSASDNSLSIIPVLPSSIKYLNISRNHVSALPALPVGLMYLYCDGNRLSSLPTLPDSLVQLKCFENNNLSTLPVLPTNLQTLECYWTSIIALPALPPKLWSLECGFNRISVLPTLPDSLKILTCEYCDLNSLPALPRTIDNIQIYGNMGITCLPRIYPQNLTTLFIANTGIICLPNRFTASNSDVVLDTFPLCQPESGCDFYYNIAGNIHRDTSANCTSDSLHPGTKLKNIKVSLLQSNQVVQQFFTGMSGEYSFATALNTNYVVAVDTLFAPIHINCPTNGFHSEYLTINDSTHLNSNFGASCSQNDYAVTRIIPTGLYRPGSNCIFLISAGSLLSQYNFSCDTLIHGTITTVVSGPAHYLSPAPNSIAPAFVSGDTLIYQINDLRTLVDDDLSINVKIDSTAMVNDLVCINVSIATEVPDYNQLNNQSTNCVSINNSHDPNLKEVYPIDTIHSGDWLTYTIHFQNTGNDTAYLILVKDTLSPYIDASSFQYIASSHNAIVQVFDRSVIFTLPKVNLVDSATNPILSQGWIQYKVKTKLGLPTRTQIKNTAYIYFDLNSAVVTNTTQNIIDTTLPNVGIDPIPDLKQLIIYPNPNNGAFLMETSNSIGKECYVSDILGQEVTRIRIDSDKQNIKVDRLSDGMYTLCLKGYAPKRFILVGNGF